MEPLKPHCEMVPERTVVELPPIPIEILNLKSFIKSHRVTYGKRNFDKVVTVGVIKECMKKNVGERNIYQYTISDPANDSSSIQAIKFSDSEARQDRNTPTMFEEDTTVFIAGRLACVNGVDGIIILAIRELDDPTEYDCLVLEAKLAQDFHVKASNTTNSRRSDCVIASTSSERMLIPLSSNLLASPSAAKKENQDPATTVAESTTEDCRKGLPEDSSNFSSSERKSSFDWSQ